MRDWQRRVITVPENRLGGSPPNGFGLAHFFSPYCRLCFALQTDEPVVGGESAARRPFQRGNCDRNVERAVCLPCLCIYRAKHCPRLSFSLIICFWSIPLLTSCHRTYNLGSVKSGCYVSDKRSLIPEQATGITTRAI